MAEKINLKHEEKNYSEKKSKSYCWRISNGNRTRTTSHCILILKARSYHYLSNLSSSYQPNNTPFQVSYFQNYSAIGYQSQETIKIGSLTIKNQTFGEATELINTKAVNPSLLYYDVSLIYIFSVFESIVNFIFFKGYMGMSPNSQILKNIFDQNQLEKRAFSTYFDIRLFQPPKIFVLVLFVYLFLHLK